MPADGDACLRVQRVDGGGGSHFDFHVDDVEAFVSQAAAAGASVGRPGPGPVILRSPGRDGVVRRCPSGRGRPVRPRRSAGGVLHLIDQLCIDVPSRSFTRERQFWSALTGWQLRASSVRTEFMYLVRPPGLPLRLLL